MPTDTTTLAPEGRALAQLLASSQIRIAQARLAEVERQAGHRLGCHVTVCDASGNDASATGDVSAPAA